MSSDSNACLLGDFLTDEDLRSLLRVDRQTLWNWRRSGRLPFFRIGRQRGLIRYRRSEVERWLLERRDMPCPRMKKRAGKATASAPRN